MRKLIALTTLAVALVAMPATAASTKLSTLKDDYFTQKKLTVQKGTVVKWTWKTKDKHTVTEYNGRWGSGSETKKGTFKHKFAKKGKFTVYCLVHPVEMRQRIVVK
jgi:plastocyanin